MSDRCNRAEANSGPAGNPGPKIGARDAGAALIIAVAIFAVLLFIALTFWSQSRIEHRAAVRHEEAFRTDMLASAGQALAVSMLRLDKKWHPNYTSLDHAWNTYFDGSWIAGKPWAFRPDTSGSRVLDRTWTSWSGVAPYRRVPYIDYWLDVKTQEAQLDRATSQALYGDGTDNDGDGFVDEPDEINQSMGSALAQIKNPLFVPRFQIDPTDDNLPSLISLLDQQFSFATTGDTTNGDFLGEFDFPVQYAYDFTNFDPLFNDPFQIEAALDSGTFNDYDPYASGWPARRITPQQKINIFADVDTDGDGLRDAMWVPIGVEVFRGGLDHDADGRVGADEGGDGIDNDLDGIIDEPDETAVFVYWGGNDGLDNDQDGQIDEANEQRVFLTAPLIADSYWGGNDGEDNDRDGFVDQIPDPGNPGNFIPDPEEQRIFLTSDDRINNNATAPRASASTSVILASEGIDYQDPGESIPLLDSFYVHVNLTTLFDFIKSPANPSPTPFASATDARLFLQNPGDPLSPSTDKIDNDFTQIVNDTHGHAFQEPTTPQLDANGAPNPEWTASGAQQNRARSYSRINVDPANPNSYAGALSNLVFPFAPSGSGLVPVITCAGETVCTVAGRVAVRVVDEASKVNLNSAGAIATVTAEDVPGSTANNRFLYLKNADMLAFAHNEGVGNGEYDTRVLPDIGVLESLDIAVQRTGEHRDTPAGGRPQNFPVAPPPDPTDFLSPVDANDSDADGTNDNDLESGYAYDSYYPGYGRTDDNANALQLQFDGIDNDGDGAYYIHDGIDNDNDGIVDEPDEARFGVDEPFEGIDEPQELQIFRPLRDRIAELDGLDNDGDGAVDEIGEMGDRLYNTGDEMAAAISSVAEMQPLRVALTVQSNDPNARYQHYIGGAQGEFARNVPPDTAPVTGMKLDYNYATPDAIAGALREDWSYPSMNDTIVNEMTFPADALHANVATAFPSGTTGPANPYWFSSSQYAPTANAGAFDLDMRLEAAYLAGMRRESMSIVGAPIGIVDTRALPVGRVLEADAGLRAYQLALNIVDSRDVDRIRNEMTYKQEDDWWTKVMALSPTDTKRVLSYTMSGTEGIRINELMVRAVRRVEAESNYDLAGEPENSPNLFVPTGGPPDFDVEVESITDRVAGATVTFPLGDTEWVHFPDTRRVGLGEFAGFRTNAQQVIIDTITYSNVLQFRIGPSAQLPAGRYYLIVNTIDENGQPTVTDPADISVRVKYVRSSDSDILNDVNVFANSGGTDPFAQPDIALTMSQLQPGYRNAALPLTAVPGMETGMVFAPTQELRPSLSGLTLPAGYEGYAGVPGEDYLQGEAYTVIVPPLATAPADQYYLCIGIRDDVPSTTRFIAVNFLDFSQEPDHEWVELANVSASSSPIDLSNWILEVGGGPTDPTSARYRIPAGTFIAPNGSLLLATNKYDVGSKDFTTPGVGIFASNGVGAASQPASALQPFGNPSVAISEPPIPRYAWRGEDGFVGQPALGANAWNGRWGEPLGSGALGGESEFQRPVAADFVDRDGDGATDTDARPDDALISSVDAPGTDVPTKAWDRIVQIEPVGGSPISFANGVATGPGDRLALVAQVVLRGGIFPNTPENDLVDNDGDSTELMRDGIDNDGDRFILDTDGIDNDGNGLTDEGADGIDNNSNGIVANGLIDDAAESEGVDENIDPRYDHDGIDNDGDTLIDEGADGADNDGDTLIDEPDESEGFGIPEGADEGGIPRSQKFDPILGPLTQIPGSFGRIPQLMLFPGEPAYVEGINSTPEWKEFTERRMFPGDCVRVTLYAGLPEEDNIVDRVTYSQNDVENRAADDVLSAFSVIPTPPLEFQDRFVMEGPDINGNPSGNARGWPANTMGVDFYRSLERKHPLYPGDRFGMANRWTATDGNYDDWGPGTNRWFFDTVASAAPFEVSMMSDFVIGPTGTPTTLSGVLFFAHGFSGSPLRANFFQRVLEDTRFGRSANPPVRLASDDAPVVPDALVQDNQKLLARARVRDANFRSPGDLLTVPHMTLSRTYANSEFDQLGREALQGPSAAPEDMLAGPVPPSVKDAAIGGDYPKDLRALIDIASFDSIVLNVGQADFYPLYPFMGTLAAGGQTELAQWKEVSANAFRAPVAWTPVFLASLDPNFSEPEGADFNTMQTITVTQSGTPQFPNLINWPGYPIQLAFLFRNADLGVVPPYADSTWLLRDNVAPPGSLASVRWPLERRAMMYVSSNPDGFRPESSAHDTVPPTVTGAPPYPSEALFVWDGADGLPNGEYDLYVVTMPDLTGVVAKTQSFDPNRQDWLPNKLDPANGQIRRRLPIDIQVLTDKDGDRKCWIDGRLASNPTPGMPDTVELGFNTQDTGTLPQNQHEKFPLRAGAVPASDGTVHYGVVKVENNFLGVFVRNWAAPSTENVNAVSRVVLMSRDKTPGRINVNTAITGPIAQDLTAATPYHAFNPLTGLIGFMAEYLPDALSDQGLFDPVPWGDQDPVATAPPYNIAAPGTYAADLRRANWLTGPWPDTTLVRPPFLPRGERFVDYNNDGLPDPPIDFNGGGPDMMVRFDGRYVVSPGELVVSGDESAFEARPFTLMPAMVPQYFDVVAPTVNQKAQQFDELKERYARMGNSLTAVSDTFEIYVVAQSGYCFDANHDGVINWRDDAEFVNTGEKKTRTVYER